MTSVMHSCVDETSTRIYESRDNCKWFAVRVRSNYERTVSAALRSKSYEEFLPLVRRRRRIAGCITETEIPLFPGYVFCRFDPARRLPILTSPGVVHILGVGKELAPVEDAEIDAVQAMVRSGLPAQSSPLFESGQKVCIIKGPLRGIEGHVVQVKSRYRLFVSVTLLRRSVSVEVDCESICHTD